MTRKTSTGILFFTLLTLSALLRAGISCEPESNAIIVKNFLENKPATIQTLLDAESANQWNKISYDAKRKILTLNADLIIGDDKGYGSYLQLGDKDFPELTIIMKGNIWIRPPRESAKRIDGKFSVMNCLTLGSKENPDIKVSLKFDCPTNYAFGFCVGERSKRQKAFRGAIRVYNSEVTALVQDGKHNWTDSCKKYGTMGWYASEAELINSRFSFFNKFYGLQTGFTEISENEVKPDPHKIIRNCVFEHGVSVLQNGAQYVEGCQFREMLRPIAEGGALNAEVINCVFDKNVRNFTLGSMMSNDLILLDCQIGEPKIALAISKNSQSPKMLTQMKRPLFPSCFIQNSLIVTVVDADGRPVPDATVDVSCAEKPSAVVSGIALTDREGKTPKHLDHALILTTAQYRATDDPEKTEKITFVYTITVRTEDNMKTATIDSANGISREPISIKMD